MAFKVLALIGAQAMKAVMAGRRSIHDKCHANE
jgi:hypothetical protein